MSNRTNDGGPAFPRPASEDTRNGTLHDGNDVIDAQDGMTLRDYFAAHAPPEPQWWFDPRMPTARPEPIFDERKENAMNVREIEAWDRERNIRRLIQWPYVWADLMIAERKGRAAS